MNYNKTIDQVGPKAMTSMAAKVAEAWGLLNMLKPLCKKANRLTAAEKEVFRVTVEEALGILRDVDTGFGVLMYPEIYNARAVKAVDS